MLLVGDIANGALPFRIDIEFDILCANLEGPLGNFDKSQKALKAGPHLCNSAPFLRADKSYIFSLANNHFWDYGAAGYQTTLKELSRYDYHAGGAGNSVQEARRPLLIDYQGKRLAFIFSCEQQFGLASDVAGGCAHEGPWIFPLIRHLREEADYIILSSHRALEMTSIPTPDARDLYRAYIDCGVNLVWGHHSHVPQVFEKYNSGFIAYGLGNFLVPPKAWQQHKNTLWSIGLDVNFRDELEVTPRYFTISESTGMGYVRETDDHQIQQYVNKYQEIFHDEEAYKRICNANAKLCHEGYCQDYIWCNDAICAQLAKKSWREFPAIIKKIGSYKRRKTDLPPNLLPYHAISCESHREAFLTHEKNLLSIDK